METGQLVKRGALLVRIDPRNARNTLAQAQADLDVAQAKLDQRHRQKRRADELFKTPVDHRAGARDGAAGLRQREGRGGARAVAVENARIQLEDTDVRAPITGTIIEKDVERGRSSPRRRGRGRRHHAAQDGRPRPGPGPGPGGRDRHRARCKPGQRATVTVDAYPQPPVRRHGAQDRAAGEIEQNVTMFPVLVRIENREGLLRPGMNTEVEMHVGRRDNVLAVPNAALRTQRDVGSAAQVLGLSPRWRRASGATGRRTSGRTGASSAARVAADHR